MKLEPGKLYRIKTVMNLYPHVDARASLCFRSFTKGHILLYLGTECLAGYAGPLSVFLGPDGLVYRRLLDSPQSPEAEYYLVEART